MSTATPPEPGITAQASENLGQPSDPIPLAPELAGSAVDTAVATARPIAYAEPPPEPPAAMTKPARLVSLDVFRGMTIAGMLLVNNPGPGGPYDPLEHAPWNGWTPTDLVFPFFAFIMGVAIPFSFAKRIRTESREYLFKHALARGLSLFLLGELCYATPYLPSPVPTGLTLARYLFAYAVIVTGFVVLLYPWKSPRRNVLMPPVFAGAFFLILLLVQGLNSFLVHHGTVPADFNFGGGMLTPSRLRIPGVLQRLGVCYAAAACITLLFNFPKFRAGGSPEEPAIPAAVAAPPTRGWKKLAAVAFLILAGYSAIMLAVPHPSLVHPGQWVRGDLGRNDNLARYVDEMVFGSHAHPRFYGSHTYGEYPDPEGLLSSLPAIATTLLGVLTGLWLRTSRTAVEKCAGLLAFGVLACVAAAFLDAWVMPINKRLWSSSYVVECAGLGLLGLGTFFYLVDVLKYRRPFAPLAWYGMNAITAFLLAAMVPRVVGMIRWQMPDPKHPGQMTTTTLGHCWSHAVSNFGRTITAQAADHHIYLGDPAHNGSLAYAISFVLVFLVFMFVLHKARIYLKV